MGRHIQLASTNYIVPGILWVSERSRIFAATLFVAPGYRPAPVTVVTARHVDVLLEIESHEDRFLPLQTDALDIRIDGRDLLNTALSLCFVAGPEFRIEPNLMSTVVMRSGFLHCSKTWCFYVKPCRETRARWETFLMPWSNESGFAMNNGRANSSAFALPGSHAPCRSRDIGA